MDVDPVIALVQDIPYKLLGLLDAFGIAIDPQQPSGGGFGVLLNGDDFGAGFSLQLPDGFSIITNDLAEFFVWDVYIAHFFLLALVQVNDEKEYHRDGLDGFI